MPNYNLAPTGIPMLECEVMPTVIRITLSVSVYSKSVAYAPHMRGTPRGRDRRGFKGGFTASTQIKALS